MTGRQCVVSLATEDRDYPDCLRRLDQSLRRVKYAAQLRLWWPGSFPAGCPPHRAAPFAFKLFCMQEARDAGFELVLWIDASCIVVRPLDRLFEQIDVRGYLLFGQESSRLGEWASDLTLDHFGVEREAALTWPEVNACVMGLNMRHPVATGFLERWRRAAIESAAIRGVEDELRTAKEYFDVKWNREGRVSADPRVRGHRHDQTVAGILAHELGMELTSEGVQSYGGGRRAIRPATAILKVRGPIAEDDPALQPLAGSLGDRH